MYAPDSCAANTDCGEMRCVQPAVSQASTGIVTSAFCNDPGPVRCARHKGRRPVPLQCRGRRRRDRPCLSDPGQPDCRAVLGGRACRVDAISARRGAVAVGYSVRDHAAAGFETIRGLVAEGRAVLFPSEQATIATTARRTLEDPRLVNCQPCWDKRFALRGD